MGIAIGSGNRASMIDHLPPGRGISPRARAPRSVRLDIAERNVTVPLGRTAGAPSLRHSQPLLAAGLLAGRLRG